MKLLISVDFLVYHHSSVILGISLVNHRSSVQIRLKLLLKVTEFFFWKVIFLPKNDFSFAFCTFISVICYFIFHHQTISSWFKKLYPGVMSHLNFHLFGRICRCFFGVEMLQIWNFLKPGSNQIFVSFHHCNYCKESQWSLLLLACRLWNGVLGMKKGSQIHFKTFIQCL